MSQVQVGEVDLCDNLLSPEALSAPTRNLNETNVLVETPGLSPSQKEGGGGCGLIQKASLSNDRKDLEGEQEKEAYTGGGREDEEEDVDEVMKEEEEEEVSEGSSSLVRCQSPDTPMTDSSYSETGREHAHMKGKNHDTVYAQMDIHFHTPVLFPIFAAHFF